VKFNKLNPKITSQTDVPFVGQIMTSRWAIEALAVNQFKDNEYEKKFYNYDKWMSLAKFRKNDWIPQMRDILGECEQDLKKPNLNQKVEDNLLLLKNEISKQLTIKPSIPYPYIDSLSVQHFSESIVNKTSEYLNSVNDYYVQLFSNYFNKEDSLIQALTRTPEAKTAFDNLKYSYTNESLENIVKNNNDLSNVIENEHALVQHIDPVFLDPIKSSIFGNAQFYAPTKKMFGQLFDTYKVNLCIIWIMSLFLIVALYFNALKGLLDLPSKIKLPFSLKPAKSRDKNT
jgi:ABC transport system ATP-binding/permease protein